LRGQTARGGVGGEEEMGGPSRGETLEVVERRKGCMGEKG